MADPIVTPIVIPVPGDPGAATSVSEEPPMDPAVQFDQLTATISVGLMNKSSQRWSDMTDLYAKNVEYDYLTTKNLPTFNQASAERRIDESGSGRARNLDTSNSLPGKTA
jgi:hypothetical protein